ncbi:MAG: hypothetical protein ACYCUV_06915 [Phycisphaerae bacterium]
MMKNQNVKTEQPPIGHRHNRWRKAVIATALGVSLLAATPALALFGGIVFDPSNFVEHILAVAASVQQLARMERQLQAQEKMLSGLGSNPWPNMAQSMQNTSVILQAGGRFAGGNPDAQMASNEPLSFGNGTTNPNSTAMAALRTQWNQNNRVAVIQNRLLENQIVANMPTDSQQISGIVAASNTAPGLTAAIEAHNQLLANLSAQVGRIIALKVAKNRLRSQLSAQHQSRQAYHAAVRQWVMHDWNNPTQSQPIADPFTDMY